MESVYYVIKQESCPACKGHRTITHPSWSAFWETGQNPTDENMGIWFGEEGYNCPPDEEIPCPECDGKGFIRREVELTEVLSFADDRLCNLEQQVTLITNIMNIGFVQVVR